MSNLTGYINPEWLQQKSQTLPTEPTVHCSKCDCEFFEEINVSKYKKTHYLLVGQAIPTANGQSFVLLRCIQCNKLHEPNLQLGTQDTPVKLHDEFYEKSSQFLASVNDR